MAKIKIISNPYDREITYYSFNEATGEWVANDEANADGYLRSIENKRCFLPFKIKEIIDLIVSEYGASDETIELIFQGTNEEYDEVEKVCSDPEYAGKITLSQADDFLENARSILVDTKELFKTVQPIIKKIVREDPVVCKDLSKVSDALDDIIPICVFGNYSSGKSTFINALIGSEILPSGGDPVTAKIYEIKQSLADDFARIRFAYHDDPIELRFDAGRFRIMQGDRTSDILTELAEIITDYPKSELIAVVNKALEFINAYEKVDADNIDISSVIQVEVPFSPNGILGQSRNNFVIFDTPGSNSASNADHSLVLEEALQGFSNGIPVWVSQYESIDSEDNAALCDRILNIKALDNRFTMIVLNKADGSELPENGFTPKQEKNILEYHSVEKMYSAGIFFVSSILGLGAKNDGVLQDKHYRRIYRTLKETYSDPEDEDYTTLYRYDIMPAQIKAALAKKCETHTDLIYANSGLYCVEQEMEDFASKYSAYNKCQMVYLFLVNVIAETNRRIESRTDTLKRNRQNRQKELDAKAQELILTLTGITAERDREFNRVSKAKMWEFISESLRYVYDAEELEALDQSIADHYSEEADFGTQESVYEKSKGVMWSHLKEHGQRLFSKDFRQAVEDLRVDFARDAARVQAARTDLETAKRAIDSSTSDDVLERVVEKYKDDFMDAKQKLSEEIKSAWLKNAAALKELLISVVTGSDALSPAQREQLSAIIMDYKALEFNDDADDVFIKAKFLRGKFLGFDTDAERLNIRRLAYRYNERIAKNIASMAQILYDNCYASFKSWMSSLMSLIEQNITEYNPELRDMAEMIREETEKIIELEGDQKTISDTLDTIRQLMEWKTKG